MIYYKDGFYHADLNENIPKDAVQITEEYWKELLDGQSNGKLITTDAAGFPVLAEPPKPSLGHLKESAVAQLWKNHKEYQQRFMDAEDLTLASVCAAGGSAMGKAMQGWVLLLWQSSYYQKKDQIDQAETVEALAAVDLTTGDFAPPPFTVRQLNEEAMEGFNNG